MIIRNCSLTLFELGAACWTLSRIDILYMLHIFQHICVMMYRFCNNATTNFNPHMYFSLLSGWRDTCKHLYKFLWRKCYLLLMMINISYRPLLWRHNGCDGVSNHQPRDCLLNHSFMCRSTIKQKLRVTGLCAGDSPVTGEFPAQMASNAENAPIWWRHLGNANSITTLFTDIYALLYTHENLHYYTSSEIVP